MTDEQIIRLSLQTTGTQKAEEMARSFTAIAQAGDAATKEVYEFADAYEVLVAESDRAMDKMVADAVDATRAQKLLADSFEATVTTTTTAGRGVQGYNFQLQAAGFAVQDFVSVNGDLSQRLMAVSNNIPGIVGGLGAWGAALGGIVAVGAMFGPQLYEYARGMAEVTNKVPPATDGVQRLKDALKENGDQLDKLREKQSLSNAELLKFNSLTSESVKLEKQLAEAVKQRKLDEELAGLRPRIEGERAAGFKAAVAEIGGGERAGEMLRQALLNIGIQNGDDFTLEGIANQADELLRGAASGDKNARDTIGRAMKFLPNGGRFADLIREQSPEARTQAEIDRAQQELDRAVAEGVEAENRRKTEEAETRMKVQDQAAKEKEKEAAEREKDRQKLRGEQADALSASTPIDELARQYFAMAGAMGGDFDPRTGRRTGRNPMTAAINDAAVMVRQANPGMDPQSAREVAEVIAQRANADVGGVVNSVRQGLNLSGRNLTAAQTNQAAIQATLQAVQMMGGRMDQVEMTARQLLGLAQDEIRRNAARRPNQMRRRN